MPDNETTNDNVSDVSQPRKKRGWVKWVVILFLLYACLGDDDDNEKRLSSQDIENGFHCLTGSDGSYPSFKEKVLDMLGRPKIFQHLETKVSRKDSQGMHLIQMTYEVSETDGQNNVQMAEGVYRNSDCAFQVTSAK